MTAYIIFRVVLALILGIVCYTIDRSLGTRWYRRWYDLTHEHPMEGLPTKGFVYGRPARVRAFAAVVVASLITLLAFLGKEFYPLQEIILWVAAVPAAFAGLLLAPKIYGLWQGRNTAFEAVDKWERGEIDISDELKARTTGIGDRLKKSITSVPDEKPAPSPQPEPAPEAAPPVEQPAAQKTAAAPDDLENADPQELVNKFLKRGQ